MKKATQLLAIILLATTTLQAFAGTGTATNQSVKEISTDNRTTKKLGAYVGILGDPHPTVFGFNVAYNVLDYMRASIGFGKVDIQTVGLGSSGFTTSSTSMTTFGAAAKFLVPQWNLSPSVSLGYSHVSLDNSVATTDYKANNFYVGFGGDWQSDIGLNLGAGLNLSMNGAAPTAPYFNVGMFF